MGFGCFACWFWLIYMLVLVDLYGSLGFRWVFGLLCVTFVLCVVWMVWFYALVYCVMVGCIS